MDTYGQWQLKTLNTCLSFPWNLVQSCRLHHTGSGTLWSRSFHLTNVPLSDSSLQQPRHPLRFHCFTQRGAATTRATPQLFPNNVPSAVDCSDIKRRWIEPSRPNSVSHTFAISNPVNFCFVDRDCASCLWTCEGYGSFQTMDKWLAHSSGRTVLAQRGRPQRRQTRWIRLNLNSLPATEVSDSWEEEDVSPFFVFVFQYKGLRMNETLLRVSEISKQTEQIQSVRCQDVLFCECPCGVRWNSKIWREKDWKV